jgi:hypothetical protein
MKGMSKEEAVARALVLVTAKRPADPNGIAWHVLTADPDFDDLPCDCTEGTVDDDITQEAVILLARAAIAAADKWDAEQGRTAGQRLIQSARDASKKIRAQSTISPGLDSAIQNEIDHGPAAVMEEGK